MSYYHWSSILKYMYLWLHEIKCYYHGWWVIKYEGLNSYLYYYDNNYNICTYTYNYIDHFDWDSSKEEEEQEGEKKGAVKPDSKDLHVVDLKKKPVGGVLTPLVPISSNIPLEDETKKLLGESKIYTW